MDPNIKCRSGSSSASRCLIYGVIIFGTGIYALIDPSLEAGLTMTWLHAAIWWGGFMAIVGGFYVVRFWPWRKQRP